MMNYPQSIIIQPIEIWDSLHVTYPEIKHEVRIVAARWTRSSTVTVDSHRKGNWSLHVKRNWFHHFHNVITTIE